MKGDVLEYLQNNILLFDGAMGTMLYNHGIYINRCFDEVNLSNPRLVKKIHEDYVKAGAEVLETNTFGANPFKLEKHGFREKLAEINKRAARIAREVAGDEVWVAGSIGPLGIRIEPWGPTSVDEAKEAFKEQALALLEGGVDFFILETFYDLSEIQQAIRAVKETCDLPIFAQMTINDDGNSLYGTSPEIFTERLENWGADVVGLNCSVGPQIMLEALEKMVKVAHSPISVQPNAGTPRNVEGRNIYLASPEYMAEYARRFILTGAKVVGGCCGTTPEYISAMAKAISSLQPKKRKIKVKFSEDATQKVKPIPFEKKTRLSAKIARGDFVTSVELVPPKGIDYSKEIEKAQTLKEAGVDAINIPDGPRALSRMGAPYLGIKIQQEAGIEVILHYTCRDRNLLGIFSSLLGIAASGIKNILLITGDPPKMGDYPDATAVFDVDSIGLTNIVNYLNLGLDLGGNPIGNPTSFAIGVGVNPGAIDINYEISRFEWKVKAGAEFAITQPVFDTDILFDFLRKIEHIRIPVIAGIWPLASLRNAEFMNNEVPGARVPEKIMRRMRKAKTKEEQRETGAEIAAEIVREIRPHVQGLQISPPFGNLKYALRVLESL